MRCVVFNCCSKNDTHESNLVSYHSFPKSDKLIRKWLKFCNRKDEINPKTARICGIHFNDEDFENRLEFEMGFAKYLRLKPSAVPTLYQIFKLKQNRIKIRDINTLVSSSHNEATPKMQDFCETNIFHEQVRVLNTIDADSEEPDEQIIKMEFVDVNEVIENLNREEPQPLVDQPLEELKKCQSEIKKLKEQIKQLQIMLNKSEFEVKSMENKLTEVFTSGQIEQLKNNSGRAQWVKPNIARKGLVDMESDEEFEPNMNEVDLSPVVSGEELSSQNFVKNEDAVLETATQDIKENDDIIVYIPVNEDDQTLITKIHNLEHRQLKIEAMVESNELNIRSALQELVLIRTTLQKNEKNNKATEEIAPKLNLPAETINELQNLEARLNNEPAVEKYLETLLIGQRFLDMTKFIRNSLAKIMTDECAKKCSWHGLQGNIAVKKYLCFKIIKDVTLKKYPNGSDEDVTQSMKKWLHLARDRLRKSNKTIKYN